MFNDFLNLRNKVHHDDFRFNLTLSLWKSHYISERSTEKNHLIELREGETLKGYAILETSLAAQYKALIVRELCANGKDAFGQLIDLIIERGVEENADSIIWRQCREPYNQILDEKGFLTSSESVIMIALLNPRELLLPLYSPIDVGRVMKLNIKEFDALTIKVGKNGFALVENDQAKFTLSIDMKTFIRLFFGKTSFLVEFLKRKISVNIQDLWTAKHFFDLIKNQNWYIPSGDWC